MQPGATWCKLCICAFLVLTADATCLFRDLWYPSMSFDVPTRTLNHESHETHLVSSSDWVAQESSCCWGKATKHILKLPNLYLYLNNSKYLYVYIFIHLYIFAYLDIDSRSKTGHSDKHSFRQQCHRWGQDGIAWSQLVILAVCTVIHLMKLAWGQGIFGTFPPFWWKNSTRKDSRSPLK